MSRTDRPMVIILNTDNDEMGWMSDFHGFGMPFTFLKGMADRIIYYADDVNEAVANLDAAGFDVVRADLGEPFDGEITE